MVAKINVGSSLFGALAYNQNKVDEEQGKVLFSNRMFESEDGNFNIQRCMESFEMHLPQDTPASLLNIRGIRPSIYP